MWFFCFGFGLVFFWGGVGDLLRFLVCWSFFNVHTLKACYLKLT